MGQEPRIGCLDMQVDLGAGTDPAAAMAKRSAESEVSECPVANVAVDVERGLGGDTREP